MLYDTVYWCIGIVYWYGYNGIVYCILVYIGIVQYIGRRRSLSEVEKSIVITRY